MKKRQAALFITLVLMFRIGPIAKLISMKVGLSETLSSA